MSLFGAFLGDYGEDPFFGGANNLMRQMDSMMNVMLQDPFANMMPIQHQTHMITPAPHQQNSRALAPFGAMGGFAMSDPFGMPSMGQMFQAFNQPGCQVFSSSSVMTMSTGPDGRPQVYQASTSTRTAPGGVREVHRSVSDSRSGVRKMAVGRHLGERGHVVEKEQNYVTGDAEEREDFINIEEEEAPHFNEEWNRRAHTEALYGGRPRIEMPRHAAGHQQYQQPHFPSYQSSHSAAPAALAITAGPSQDQSDHQRHRSYPRGVGPERHARRRDGGHRSGKSRHETSM